MALPESPPVPEGTTELGIDIIKIERIARGDARLRRPLPNDGC